jgi:hypothetical protein
LALGGDTAALAGGTTVTILHGIPGTFDETARFDLPAAVERLEVAPDGRSVLVWSARARQLWRWAEGEGHRLIAQHRKRNPFGAGFLAIGPEVLTVLGQDGVLRGIAAGGEERFLADLVSRFAFTMHGLVRLSPGHLALFGHEADDYHDAVATVPVEQLLTDRAAVQEALRLRRPVYDRAVRNAIGPCRAAAPAAVVYRDPEDEEVPEDEEEREELGDVGNFTGVYVRDLGTGALVERLSYRGGARGVRAAASERLAAFDVVGGIDVVTRGSGEIHEIRAAAATLDPDGMRAAWVAEDGRVNVVALDSLLDVSSTILHRRK